jgi:hypothetical protein
MISLAHLPALPGRWGAHFTSKSAAESETLSIDALRTAVRSLRLALEQESLAPIGDGRIGEGIHSLSSPVTSCMQAQSR